MSANRFEDRKVTLTAGLPDDDEGANDPERNKQGLSHGVSMGATAKKLTKSSLFDRGRYRVSLLSHHLFPSKAN